MRRTPLKAKRETPRRNEGRVTHARMKPLSSAKSKSAEERRHMGKVSAMPCLVCRGAAEVHHVTSDGDKRITKSHKRVVPLCSVHHRTGPAAVHRKGHAWFTSALGLNLLTIADQLWEAHCGRLA